MSVRLVKSEGQTAQAWAAATDAMAEEYGDREKAEQNVEFLKALADLDANEQDYMFWALNILAGRRPNDIAKTLMLRTTGAPPAKLEMLTAEIHSLYMHERALNGGTLYSKGAWK